LVRKSNKGRGVNVGKLTGIGEQSAAVAALGWVSASASQAFTRRWQACDSVADRAGAADEPISKSFRVDPLRIGKANRVVAGRDSGEIVAMRIVDGGRL
jgi:hypothetical protein